MNQLLTDLESLVQPTLATENIELVDLTYQKEPAGWTLTFYLDKPGGFGLSDCETWSRRLEEILDQSNLIERAYNLEISSPGINRPLKKTADFQKFAGTRVHVRLFAALNGQKNFHGTLLGADEENIRLQLEDTKQEILLARAGVAKAKLDPIIDF